MSTRPGAFITLEGIDSSGKSDQAARLGEWLANRGIDHIVTREPGGTPFGEQVRELLLAPSNGVDDPVAELLLFVAARRRHLSEVIRPALGRGAWVVCDRFSDSTLAYQGGGKGLGFGPVETVSKAAGTDLQPDLTVLIDIAPQTSIARRKLRDDGNRPGGGSRGRLPAEGQGLLWEDSFENRELAFHERVRDAYRRIAERHHGRIHTIDGERDPGEIHADIRDRVALRFGLE